MILPTTTPRFLLYFIRQQWWKFLIIICTSILWATNDALFPYFLKLIVNALQHYHGDRNFVYSAIALPLVLIALFWAGTEILLRIQGVTMVFTLPSFRANIRGTVFDYVKSHSHEYFSSNFSGTIAKKLSDLPTSCQSLVEIFYFNFVPCSMGAILSLAMMWQTKPIFAAILLTWLCLHLGLTGLLLRYGNHLWQVHSDSVSLLSGKIVDVFTNMMNVRLFARGQHEKNYLKKFQQDEINKAKKSMWMMEFTRIGLGINGLFLIMGMLFFLVYGWVHHWVTLGDFTQVGMQTFWLMGWIWFISFQMTVFAREAGTVTDALTIIKKGHDIVDTTGAPPIVITHGEIRFQDVCFSYQKKRVVFDNLNVTIPAGQKVGLVGFSGSGKSTFVNLILRFYDLESGRILIDNQNIAHVTQDSLRSQIGMIPQDPSLFHRTLMENIRYGRLDASDEEVIRASKLAHCHEFIDKLDDGYESLVGERGIKLSGGQRQRIAIARAILKNAPVLILDEATSSLDSVTEKLIQESLNDLMRGRTAIVIAHRLSTLANMDRILVFDKGRIIEEGTKESLLQTNSHFSVLWNMQTDGFLPEDHATSKQSSTDSKSTHDIEDEIVIV